MARLVYSAFASLDLFVEDPMGSFSWATPDEALQQFVNEQLQPVRTHLLGRKTWDELKAWDSMDPGPRPAAQAFAASWKQSDKIVFTQTRTSVDAPRTRLEPVFDAAAVQAWKNTAPHDLSMLGPHLAAHAFAAGLIDEVQLFLFPIAVGDGTRALPPGLTLRFQLLEERRFPRGTLFLRYALRR